MAPIRLLRIASLFSPKNTHYHTLKTRIITSSSVHAQQQTMDFEESIANQTDVSLSLTKHVISFAKAKDRNFVFSPLSIHVVLSMIAAGSKGPTRDQLLGFLKFKSPEQLGSLVTLLFADGAPLGGPRLSFANGVWVDQSLRFKPAFKEVMENAYKAASYDVDFQTKVVEVTKEVNTWAEKQTNGLIKEILPFGSVDAITRLIFANAVYFKGAWSKKFDSSKTKDHKFFLLNGSSIQVPFMTSSKKQYVRAFDGFKVLQLPYKQGKDTREFSMYFFLPDAKDGLPFLLEKVGSESKFIERHLPYQEIKIGDFLIPKFKINFDFEASGVLKVLGLVLPFSDHEDGLTEMVDSNVRENLYVSSIFHKSFIEVNEEGTEAAAVSGLFLRGCSRRIEKKLDFVADHPFLFVIREDTTGVVLFVGQVLNPLVG
ncbi:hypothetical protein BUALT_Bualt17G0041600 [Buddleja alternifolia]|uniref:Serpin domain-containing protein n=1 Tax=Buddleja alternifolia TaxID=168488 RepID=A0AAV6W7L2_9LAMI|nr:hypothetical protein BUALT_Bualt17G0041600 [Buddleja alternifolia]